MKKKDLKKCCGCNACSLICPTRAIEQYIDEKGFYSTKVLEQQCICCNKCELVCPINEFKSLKIESKYFGFMTKRINDRIETQSGGAFYTFANYILSIGGFVYGVGFNGIEAFYKRIANKEDLFQLTGSKYIQARVGNIYALVEKDLLKNLIVLFSGTPCYVSGLKNYLKFRKVNTKKLFLIDLVCHGVPSPSIYSQYIDNLNNRYGKVERFNFRDKTIGWHNHICSFYIGSDKYYSKDFVEIFYSNVCLNEACYECQYANLDRVGDVSIADLWGSQKKYPELNDNIGTSLVIVNSEKGQFLKEKIEPYGEFKTIEIDKCYQKNLYEATDKPDCYNTFWEKLNVVGFEKTVEDMFGITFVALKNKEEFWVEYCIDELVDKLGDAHVYLYGIGVPMIQLIELLEEYNVKIVGLLDRKEKYIGQFFKGIEVINSEKLSKDMQGVVVICSRNKENISNILARLKQDKNYERIILVTLDEFRVNKT